MPRHYGRRPNTRTRRMSVGGQALSRIHPGWESYYKYIGLTSRDVRNCVECADGLNNEPHQGSIHACNKCAQAMESAK
tara:strand:- start:9365 stop:9598 length:234 start_codon:yes stop_codon:yes gene_type:complete